jgi:hypothetical protein
MITIGDTNKLIPEHFTEQHCNLAKDTVYRLSTNTDKHCPYYLQHCGDRFKIFTTQTKDFSSNDINKVVTDLVTVAVFRNIGEAVEYLENNSKVVVHNQPYLD